MSSSLRVLCCTWNINAQPLGLDSLSSWICPPSQVEPPHIVVVAFQEVVDLKDLKHYINEDETLNLVRDWGIAVADSLKMRYPKISYTTMKRASLVGCGLIMMVQSPLVSLVRDAKKSRVATGTFGMLGNKGGLGIRFRFLSPSNGGEETTFCFVGMHLSAHQHEVSKRNQDWEQVLTKLEFNRELKDATNKSSSLILVGYEDSHIAPVRGHDCIFVLGDLNYRVDVEDQATVFQYLRKKELTPLLEKDQLLNSLKNERIFEGFNEALITFPPTYKFEPGTSKYESREGKKKRIPSWCDRILFRSLKHEIRCEKYRACPCLIGSDHKPVAALYVLDWIQVPDSTSNSGNVGGRRGSADEIDEQTPLGQFAVVHETTTPKLEFDLALRAGEQVEVIRMFDDVALVARDFQVGFCPKSSLRMIGVFASRITPEVLKLAQIAFTGRIAPPAREITLNTSGTVDYDTDDETTFEKVEDEGGWLQAITGFMALKEEELSFRTGEMVEILSRNSGVPGFWIGRVRNLDQGLVPAYAFQDTTRKNPEYNVSPSHHFLKTESLSFEGLNYATTDSRLNDRVDDSSEAD